MSDNRCGIIAIIGRPNTGKSTLLNAILGEEVSIVSRVPQTTRNLIRGILTEKRGQIVFVDTPGIHKPRHRLASQMNIASAEAIRGADIVLHIVDSSEPPGEEEDMVVAKISGEKKKIVLALNKIDLGGKFVDAYLRLWEGNKGRPINELTDCLIPIPISALRGTNVGRLLGVLFPLLPLGENLYPNDMLTDFPRRLAFADIVRKRLFELMRQEVPHSIAVHIDEISERSDRLTYIRATIFVERPSQKAIVIGSAAKILKKVGSLSRKELEDLLGKKVYLDLGVKVKPGWKDDYRALELLGYI